MSLQYTAEEDRILVSYISNTKLSKEKACLKVAKKLGRTKYSVQARYYWLTSKKNVNSKFFNVQNASRFQYNTEHLKEIANLVNKYPTNIAYATKIFADKYNISYRAANSQYYNKIKKNPSKYGLKVGVLSDNGYSHGVKNLAIKDNSLPDQQLKTHLWIIKELLNLPEDKRRLIIDIFSN